MKKILVLIVLLAGLSLAQQNYYAGGGISLASAGATAVGLSGMFGVENIGVQDLDGRLSIDAYFLGIASLFRVAGDGIYNFDIPDSSVEAYAGGGLRLVQASLGNYGLGGTFGFGLLAGADFPITPDLAPYAEVRVDFYGASLLGIAAGMKFKF